MHTAVLQGRNFRKKKKCFKSKLDVTSAPFSSSFFPCYFIHNLIFQTAWRKRLFNLQFQFLDGFTWGVVFRVRQASGDSDGPSAMFRILLFAALSLSASLWRFNSFLFGLVSL